MLRVLQESYLQDNTSHLSISEWATLMAFLCAYIPDPRFADYGKVELVFSEGPERIPGRSPNLLLFFFFQKLLKGVGKADTELVSPFFPSCRAGLCSVPPPLPPGEEGCGMLQRGNVV